MQKESALTRRRRVPSMGASEFGRLCHPPHTTHYTHSVLARRILRRAPNVNTRASLCSILSRSYVPCERSREAVL